MRDEERRISESRNPSENDSQIRSLNQQAIDRILSQRSFDIRFILYKFVIKDLKLKISI